MLSYVDAPYEHLCKCDHLTKSSSWGDMRRSPHASPPPRAREFSGGVISHHLTNFGVVPAKAICRTRTIFFAKAFYSSVFGSAHEARPIDVEEAVHADPTGIALRYALYLARAVVPS